MYNQNFEYLEDDYSEKLISRTFGENHHKVKNFEDFKSSIKSGKISLNFKYDVKLIREYIDNQNFGFFIGIKNLKNLGTLIYLGYYIFFHQEYNLLFLIPILYLINKVIFFMWYKKLMTFIILILITFTICTFFNFNHKIFLISFILLQSICHSAYLTFLEEYFSHDEIRFGFGIEDNIITKIYDSYTNKIIDNEIT